jgi:hypothetical protein
MPKIQNLTDILKKVRIGMGWGMGDGCCPPYYYVLVRYRLLPVCVKLEARCEFVIEHVGKEKRVMGERLFRAKFACLCFMGSASWRKSAPLDEQQLVYNNTVHDRDTLLFKSRDFVLTFGYVKHLNTRQFFILPVRFCGNILFMPLSFHSLIVKRNVLPLSKAVFTFP